MSGILIIDDNPQVRCLIRGEVADLAAQVYESADGAEAVELYGKYLPDWVLMDLEMRLVDGLTATRRIIARFPQARICIVTNHDDPFLREEAREAGARGYVVKTDLNLLRPVLIESASAH